MAAQTSSTAIRNNQAARRIVSPAAVLDEAVSADGIDDAELSAALEMIARAAEKGRLGQMQIDEVRQALKIKKAPGSAKSAKKAEAKKLLDESLIAAYTTFATTVRELGYDKTAERAESKIEALQDKAPKEKIPATNAEINKVRAAMKKAGKKFLTPGELAEVTALPFRRAQAALSAIPKEERESDPKGADKGAGMAWRLI